MPIGKKLALTEAERLVAVRRYDILDSPPDGAFDRITALAARRFGVPIAIISIVDEDRIWFKSHHGLPVEQIDREPGLCASAILGDTPYLIEDARGVTPVRWQTRSSQETLAFDSTPQFRSPRVTATTSAHCA